MENIKKGLELIYQMEKHFEMWKPIEGFEKYSISSFGRVKNVKKNITVKQQIRSAYYSVILRNNGIQKTFDIHRLVAKYFIVNSMNKPVVDHIDRNKLNNHFHNLRWVTISENSMNSKFRSHNTSGFTGVGVYKPTNKYVASITINRRKKNLGYFDDIEDAIKARKDAEIKYFGVYSPNF
jgi:hypothetical protein